MTRTLYPATAAALDLRARGHTISDASAMAGVHRSTLQRAARDLGHTPAAAVPGTLVARARTMGLLPPPAERAADVGGPRRTAEVARGVELARSGHTVADAARLAGCSRQAITAALRADGEPPRKPGRRPQSER